MEIVILIVALVVVIGPMITPTVPKPRDPKV